MEPFETDCLQDAAPDAGWAAEPQLHHVEEPQASLEQVPSEAVPSEQRTEEQAASASVPAEPLPVATQQPPAVQQHVPADPTLIQAAPLASAADANQAREADSQTGFGPGSTLVRPQPSPQAGAYRAPDQPQMQTGYVPQQPSFQRSYAAPTPTVEAAAPRAKSSGGGHPLLWGVLGGLIGAVAVAGCLVLSGVLVPRVSATGVQNAPVSGQQGTASFSITASDTEVSVAKAVAAKALPSVVSVHCSLANGTSTGSGVILDEQGNIITNNHVIEGAQSITVTIEGTSFDAVVVGTDPSSDIAVIKADLGGVPVTPIEVGDSSALTPGDWVMTVGSPFGLDSSVSSGIVSSLYRSELMYGNDGNTLYANLIQVDAAINPGNSGGALVNDQGKLVGICTLFSSDTQSFAGIGFAIPGNYAVEIAQMIIAGEQVTHAYIGLSMATVTPQNAEANGLSVDYGAYVAEVIEDGPAEAAGLQVGDVVIAIGGDRIESADDAVLAVRSHHTGETVAVTVMRGEERVDFTVTLGSDEKLQELQQQQREQQQREQEQQNDFWNRDGEGDGSGYTMEDLFNEWLEDLMGEDRPGY